LFSLTLNNYYGEIGGNAALEGRTTRGFASAMQIVLADGAPITVVGTPGVTKRDMKVDTATEFRQEQKRKANYASGGDYNQALERRHMWSEGLH
jgi:hypothetical protein